MSKWERRYEVGGVGWQGDVGKAGIQAGRRAGGGTGDTRDKPISKHSSGTPTRWRKSVENVSASLLLAIPAHGEKRRSNNASSA